MHCPLGRDPPFPCSTPGGRPSLASARNGRPFWTEHRRLAFGLGAGGRVVEATPPDLPFGGVTTDPPLRELGCAGPTRAQAWRPEPRTRLRPFPRLGTSDRDTWTRFGGTYRHDPNIRSQHRDRPRSDPPLWTGRPVAANGPASVGPLTSTQTSGRPRPPRLRPFGSKGDRWPSPGRPVRPHGTLPRFRSH